MNNSVVDSVVVCFDLDDTLIHEGFYPYIVCDNTFSILEYHKQLNHIIIITSCNDKAKEICINIEIDKFIDYYATHDDNSKINQYKEVLERYGNNKLFIIYDDLEKHLEEARSVFNNVELNLVNWKSGAMITKH
jgi:hypothetical protein